MGAHWKHLVPRWQPLTNGPQPPSAAMILGDYAPQGTARTVIQRTARRHVSRTSLGARSSASLRSGSFRPKSAESLAWSDRLVESSSPVKLSVTKGASDAYPPTAGAAGHRPVRR
jgi:hypothetical protein